MARVTIFCNEFSSSVIIGDISPERLQECFELSKPPEFLLDKEANEIIDSKYWKELLKAGHTYHIKHQGNILHKLNTDEEDAAKTIGIDDSFGGIVLRSLIASIAVYKMEHIESDKESIEDYLTTQTRNHSFDYITPSKHGKNFYLIAKEKGFNRIYVAFRGAADLLDWKSNLQVALCNFFHFYLCFSFCIFLSKVRFSTSVLESHDEKTCL